jgi:hypothetical protein
MISKEMKNPKINFIASVNNDRIGDIEAIARSLKNLGCTINNVLSLSGVITGSASSEISLNDLKIDGIKNVEPERKVTATNKLNVEKNKPSQARRNI